MLGLKASGVRETSLLPMVKYFASKTNPTELSLAASLTVGANFTVQFHMHNSPQPPPRHLPSYLPRTNSTRRLISRSVSPRVQPDVSGSAGNANRDNHAKEEGLEIVRKGHRRQGKADRQRERGTNLPAQAVDHSHMCSAGTYIFPQPDQSHRFSPLNCLGGSKTHISRSS